MERRSKIATPDSYLFVTSTNYSVPLKNAKYRAFVVPKSNPSKQFEIPALMEFDLEHNEGRVKLKREHNLIFNLGTLIANIDGKPVRSLDTSAKAIDPLVAKNYEMWGWSAKEEDTTTFTGTSWVYVTKDRETGVIRRFTQSPNSGRGRLETIQGDPEGTVPENDTENNIKSFGKGGWMKNGEIDRKPLSVVENAFLPEDLRQHMVQETYNTFLQQQVGARAWTHLQLMAQSSPENGIAAKHGGDTEAPTNGKDNRNIVSPKFRFSP